MIQTKQNKIKKYNQTSVKYWCLQWHQNRVKIPMQLNAINGFYRSYWMRPITTVWNSHRLGTTDRWNGRGTRRKDVWRQQQRSISKILLGNAHLVHPGIRGNKNSKTHICTGKVMRSTAICFKLLQQLSDNSINKHIIAIFWEPCCLLTSMLWVHHYDFLDTNPSLASKARWPAPDASWIWPTVMPFCTFGTCVSNTAWSLDSKWSPVEAWDCLKAH